MPLPVTADFRRGVRCLRAAKNLAVQITRLLPHGRCRNWAKSAPMGLGQGTRRACQSRHFIVSAEYAAPPRAGIMRTSRGAPRRRSFLHLNFALRKPLIFFAGDLWCNLSMPHEIRGKGCLQPSQRADIGTASPVLGVSKKVLDTWPFPGGAKILVSCTAWTIFGDNSRKTPVGPTYLH
jgi:hypothetical protein